MRGPSMDRWPEDEQQTTVQSCRIAHDIFWFTKKSMNRGWPDQRIEPKNLNVRAMKLVGRVSV